MVWGGFILLVLAILAFDLGIFSRESKALSAKTALIRTTIYFILALLFTVFVYFAYENGWGGLGAVPANQASQDEEGHVGTDLPENGWEAAAQFFMGYILEQSLSIDNIFVIALILSYFQIPNAYQHRVLLWGILGALVMRGVMIFLGIGLIQRFAVTMYLFGALLLFTAFKMLFAGEGEVDFEKSRIVRITRRYFRLHPHFVGDHFFTRVEGKLEMTPMFLSLIIVETTDLVFAIDSIPAVIGLTQDPFLVFTSNVFAILGLRSLYFALADLLSKFRYLKYSLVAILAFVGVKMLVHDFIPHSQTAAVTIISLAFIAISLGIGIGVSLSIPENHASAPPPHEEHPS